MLVSEADHPFWEHWWPPGHIIGWGDTFVHELHHLLTAIRDDSDVAPHGATFEDGYRAAEVCDAMVRSSESGRARDDQLPLRAHHSRVTGPGGIAALMRAMTTTRLLLIGAICLLLALPAAAPARPHHGHGHGHHAQPLVIGHRGASGYRPEHTLASYALAARMGADYIEPDLVSTKDGVLVARHEPEIGGTTDVADHPEFAARRTTKIIDGISFTGWFTEDFTLARAQDAAREGAPPGAPPAEHALRRPVRGPDLPGGPRPARAALAQAAPADRRLPRDQAPDLLPLARPAARAGARARAATATASTAAARPCSCSPSSTDNLRALDPWLKVPLVQLLDAPDAPTRPATRRIPPTGSSRRPPGLPQHRPLRRWRRAVEGLHRAARRRRHARWPPTSFVRDAHAAGLQVHPYTFRRENQFLPLELRSSADPNGIGDLEAEIRQFFALGVDGVFTDNPDIGVAARRR